VQLAHDVLLFIEIYHRPAVHLSTDNSSPFRFERFTFEV
jgi:hypothetical protein